MQHSGYIYVITNPAWPDWSKIGRTKQKPEDRLKQYHIGSPHRDYELVGYRYFESVYEIEQWFYSGIVECKGEWVNMTGKAALNMLNELTPTWQDKIESVKTHLKALMDE